MSDYSDQTVLKVPVKDVLKMLMFHEPNKDSLFHVANALWASPFTKEQVIAITYKWWSSKSHTGEKPVNIKKVVEHYHKKEQTNRWLFVLLKKCPPEFADPYRQKALEQIQYEDKRSLDEQYYADLIKQVFGEDEEEEEDLETMIDK